MDGGGPGIMMQKVRRAEELMRKGIQHLAIAVMASVTGCGVGTFHQVTFAGESAPDLPRRVRGQTVYVVPNGQMTDSLAEMRIRAQLEAYLLEQGYTISTPEKADVYVLATFGTGTRVTSSQASVFKPAEVTIVRDRQGNPLRRQFNPDRVESLRVPALENSVWLQVLSSDANYFRETGLVKNFWRGEAVMKAGQGPVSSALPYLLVPALKFFGRPTTSVVTMDVRDKDLASREVP